MNPLTRTLAAVPVLMTALPLSNTGKGWVRIWEFPRVQIALLALAARAAVGRNGSTGPADRVLRAALTASAAWQMMKILPYTRMYPRQVKPARDYDPERCIRLLISNVYMYNRESRLLLEQIRQAEPDIICLMEVDGWWDEQTRELENDYPYANRCPLPNTYGMILYSKLPWARVETRFLTDTATPSMRALLKLRSGDEVMLHCLHPCPPTPGSPVYGRNAELVLVGREIESEDRPAIVAGDLNDVAWSHTTTLFQKISRTLDPRVGRGMYNSFHADHPLMRYPLDHVFHTSEFTLVSLQRLPNVGSDHFPILVELAYTPHKAAEQPEPEASPADQEEADEIESKAGKQKESF